MRYSRLLTVFELGSLLVMLTLAGPAAAAEEAICSDPNVIFCDNFNDRTLTDDIRTSGNFGQNLGGKTLNWFFDQSPGQRIISSGCLEGNCFAQDYPATPRAGDNGGGGFIGTPNLGSFRTMYYRIWIKYPTNWVESPNGSKILYMENSSGSPREELMSQRPGPASPGTWPVLENVSNIMRGAPNISVNSSSAQAPLGVWTCVEYRLTAESASGASDGTFESWVNDVQVASYPNVSFNGPGGQFWNDYLISAYWNCPGATLCLDPQNTHPTMTRLIDRVVISRARIGCSGTGSGTTASSPAASSPPAPPGQVQAR